MKKALTIVFAGLIALLCAQAKETIKIGFILPLTGDVASYGMAARDAALLRAKELQTQKTKFEYKLLFEDNNSSEKDSLLAANRLVGLNQVDFLVSYWGNNAVVVLPVAQRAHIPHMTIIAWNPKAVGKSPLNCTLTSSAEAETELALSTAQKLGYKRIAIIRLKAFDPDWVIEALKQISHKKHMDIVADIPYNPGEREFLPLMWKIKEAKPDLLINMSEDPETFIIEKRAREVGLSCDITVYDGMYDGYETNEYIQGHWYITCAESSSDFIKAYQATYNRTPEYGTAFVYEAVELISQAYEASSSNGEKPSSQKVAAWLRSIHGINGAVGELNCDSRGFIDTKPRLMRIDHGKGVSTTAEELLKLKDIK